MLAIKKFNILLVLMFITYCCIGILKFNFNKLDDIIIAFFVFIFVFNFKISKKRLWFFIPIGFWCAIWFNSYGIEILYWLYLIFLWSIVILAPKSQKEISITLFTYFIIFFVAAIAYMVGSRTMKDFGVDLNVLFLFLALLLGLGSKTAIGKIIQLFILSYFTRSRAVLSLLITVPNKQFLIYILAFSYLVLYLTILFSMADDPATKARSQLLVNHILNLLDLNYTQWLLGAGPRAYLDFSVYVEDAVWFVASKPKTVDSAILRVYLEFGLIVGTLLLYALYRYIDNLALFIVVCVALGLSNEGLLSVFGPFAAYYTRQIAQQSRFQN